MDFTLVVLFVAFLATPSLASWLGRSLDTLPVRLAATLSLLAAMSYDPFIALGLFLVVGAIYIQHHNDDLGLVFGSNLLEKGQRDQGIKKGGRAKETENTMTFMPDIHDIQTDEFEAQGPSIDEKDVLPSEPLGSRAQALFGDDMRSAEALQRGNSDAFNTT